MQQTGLIKKSTRVGSKMEFDMEYNLGNGTLIGQGSFGSVYKLLSSDDNNYWAVKIIEVPDRDNEKEGAEHELDIFLQMSQHPNVIGIKQVYTWTNDLTHKFAAAIVMELADKGLYEDSIQRRKAQMSYSDDEVLNYLTQTIDALSFLKERNGIYHRDIKTENLLLKNGQIKITDFGVSKRLETEKALTLAANTVTGTPLFLSPKIWEAYNVKGESTVKHDLEKSDIFSLGVVFIQIALMLPNSDVVGLNQPDNEKKLLGLLMKVKSNKLRTIFAGMLAYEEKQRADYNTLKRFLIMNETDFTDQTILPFLPQAAKVISYPIIEPVVQYGVNLCYRHNKEMQFFCEEESCCETMCIDCKAIHSSLHLNKVIPLRQAVQKYIDQNTLNNSYQNITAAIQREIKGKVQTVGSQFQNDSKKIEAEFRAKLVSSFDQAISRWTSDFQNKIQNIGREGDSIFQQIQGDEMALKESQFKYKSNPINNSVYLPIIVKSQQNNEKKLQTLYENLNRLTHDCQQRFNGIEQLYICYLTQSAQFERQFQNQIESFLTSMLPSSSQGERIRGASDSSPHQYQINSENNSNYNNFIRKIPNNFGSPNHGNQQRNYSPNSSNQAQSPIALQIPVSAPIKYISPKFSSSNSNGPKPSAQSPLNLPVKAQNLPESSSSGGSTGISSSTEGTILISNILPSSAPPVPSSGSVEKNSTLIPTKEFKVRDGQLQQLIYVERSKSSRYLICTQQNGKIVKINLENKEQSEVTLANFHPLCSVYMPSIKMLVCGTLEGKIIQFDPKKMQPTDQGSSESQSSSITCLVLTDKKPQKILCGGKDGSVALWNFEKRVQERVYSHVHQGETKGIAFIINETLFVSVGSDKAVVITEMSTSKTLAKKSEAHEGSIISLKIVNDNSFFTAGSDGYVKLWRWINGDIAMLYESQVHSQPITYLDYLSEYDLLITSATDGSLFFTEPKTNEYFASTKSKFLSNGATGAVWVRPILYTCDSKSIQICEDPSFAGSMVTQLKKVQESANKCPIF